MKTTCPNCGRPHVATNGNNYCESCAAHFRRIGIFDGIDDCGEFFHTTELPHECSGFAAPQQEKP